MASLIDKLCELRMMRLHGERVADIVLAEAERDDDAAEVDANQITPAIEIKNLSFQYSDSESEVIRELNLTIPAGQCVAITGPSDCGKTTLMKLLLGLLTPPRPRSLPCRWLSYPHRRYRHPPLGGQRQRILLARALYKNPKILVLDEATSHLDVWNEQAVNAAIQKIPLTRILVAHRPETIQMAERVILLHNGQVAQDVTQSAP